MDGHQVGGAGGPPRGAVAATPPGRHQAVDVRMVGQGAGPRVQHTQDPHQAADVMRVRGERHERLGRGAEPNVGQVFLVAADELPQFWGQGQDDRKGGTRQAFLPPLFQPHLGVMAVALGATPVTAGVVAIGLLPAGVTLSQVPAEGFGPAVHKSLHGPPMAGQQVLPKPVEVLAPRALQDVRHLRHHPTPGRAAIGHEGGDGGVHDVQGRGRQRGVAGGGTQALGAEPRLHDPQRHPAFQQRGGRGVAQRLDGGLVGDAALAHHRFARLVEGGGG